MTENTAIVHASEPTRVEQSHLAAALAARRKELDRLEAKLLKTLDAIQAERGRIDRYFDVLG